MTSRSRHAGPSRRAPEPIQLSDSEIDLAVEDKLISQQANDRRLRQAISYLATEGGDDSLQQYVNRVQKINKDIVQQFAVNDYSFDLKLYQQLRAMVREVQSDLIRAAEEDSDDIEEVESVDALYRQEEDPPEASSFYQDRALSPVKPNPAQAATKAMAPRGELSPAAASTAQKPRLADARKIQFRYGGPENEVEEWHKDFPPSLPFGETLYIQEWESMMINYDLRKSAEKKAGDSDPVVHTNVPYDSVKQYIPKGGRYDSGSRFLLPKISDDYRDWMHQNKYKVTLKQVTEDFNKGDPEKQIEKDYAPRIFLENVVPHPNHNNSPFGSRPYAYSFSAAQHPSQSSWNSRDVFADTYEATKPTDGLYGEVGNPSGAARRHSVGHTTAGPSTARSPVAPKRTTSRIGTINREVRAKLLERPQRGPRPTGSVPLKTSERSNNNIRKGTHSAVVQWEREQTEKAKRKTTPTPKTSAKATPRPTVRRLSHIKASPSGARRPGRPRNNAPVSTSISPPASGRKRKLYEADDSYEEASSKRKKAKPAKIAIASKKVGFVEDSEDSGDEAIVKTPVKKPASRPTAKPAVKPATKSPVPLGKPLRSIAGFQSVKRGVTRSGVKFK